MWLLVFQSIKTFYTITLNPSEMLPMGVHFVNVNNHLYYQILQLHSTSLHEAAEQGNLDAVIKHLVHKGTDINTKDELRVRKQPCMHWLCMHITPSS